MDTLTYIFTLIASWRGHPGWSKGGLEPPTLEQCMTEALAIQEILKCQQSSEAEQQQQQADQAGSDRQ